MTLERKNMRGVYTMTSDGQKKGLSERRNSGKKEQEPLDDPRAGMAMVEY